MSTKTHMLELPRKPEAGGESLRTVVLEMSHVRLGCLDEYSLMVLFGTGHSLYLTEGLTHQADEIRDSGGHILYPAYFMTHLKVPPGLALESFKLWDAIRIGTEVRRFGGTLLESRNTARGLEDPGMAITMEANSLFILDPGIHRSRNRQVSSPAKGAIRDLEKLSAPPVAIQESARVRANGFSLNPDLGSSGTPFHYDVEFTRDVDAGHPLIFAKMPLFMDLSERDFLRWHTRRRISEDILQAVRLSERKTFYYGNAFSGRRLTLHTRGAILPVPIQPAGVKVNLHHTHRLDFETELYDGGELLAISKSKKFLVFGIQDQSLIQDAKRMFQLQTGDTGSLE